MTTAQITTETAPNGLTIATDLAPFAKFVNGTVTFAVRYSDSWDVHYRSPKGRSLRKSFSLDKLEAGAEEGAGTHCPHGVPYTQRCWQVGCDGA
jgi:hypothetical protein